MKLWNAVVEFSCTKTCQINMHTVVKLWHNDWRGSYSWSSIKSIPLNYLLTHFHYCPQSWLYVFICISTLCIHNIYSYLISISACECSRIKCAKAHKKAWLSVNLLWIILTDTEAPSHTVLFPSQVRYTVYPTTFLFMVFIISVQGLQITWGWIEMISIVFIHEITV